MIKRFGSFYVGHLDMDNMGLAGTPVLARRFSREQTASVFERARAIAQTMERVGFDTLWLAEHHFQPEGYECIPNITLLAVHLAGVTKRLRFGAAFNIIPTWHPLRLAEDYATADWVTDGRVRLGVGRGYQTRELETFGAPVIDQEANRELFEEQVEIMLKAFNQETFSHRGKYYTIPPPVPFGGEIVKEITLVPRPRTLPVEIWQPMVSRTARGLEFMAKHGIKGFAGPNLELATAWRETLARHGRETELGGDLLFSVGGYLADNPEQAFRETRLWREEVLKRHAAEGFPRGLTPEQIAALGDPRTAPGVDVNLDERRAGALYGPPEYMVEQLLEIQDQYPGVEEVNFGPGECAPLSVFLQQLEWFGEKVIKPFKRANREHIENDTGGAEKGKLVEAAVATD